MLLWLWAAPGCASTPQGPPPPSAASPLVQQTAPDFKRPTLRGPMLDTQSLRGRVVVVKFFAEYCEPCKRTLPAAQALHERYDQVAFIGVSEDERQDSAQNMVNAFGLTFPVVMDRANVLAGRYRVRELPITFVIDAAGTVAWVGGPSQDHDDLERVLTSLLSS